MQHEPKSPELPRREPDEVRPPPERPEAFPARSPEAHPGQPEHEIEPFAPERPEIGPVAPPDATPEPGPDREIPAA